MSDKSKIRRRLRCPRCGSLNNVKWGVREGVQRFKCHDCGSLFSSRRKDVSHSNKLIWFRKWVLGKQTIEDISKESGYSTRQLHRLFDEYLDESHTWIVKVSQPIYLLIDGTYYSNDHCLIVYRAENLKRTVYYRFTTRENENEIAEDLINIRSIGYTILGITTDGGENIIRAVQYVFPDVPRQRCVVHVQRECLSSITLRPRSTEAKLFRNLVQKLSDVGALNDMLWWKKLYEGWVEDNEAYALETAVLPSTNRIYHVHEDLWRAYVHLKRSVPNLFTYIEHPGVPKTTNALESFWGHIKDQLRIHRGLAESRVDNFIRWYLFFNDEKKSNH